MGWFHQAHLDRLPRSITEGEEVSGCEIDCPPHTMPKICLQRAIYPREKKVYRGDKVRIKISSCQTQGLPNFTLKASLHIIVAKLNQRTDYGGSVELALVRCPQKRLNEGQP